jgi:hypothetical protein
MTDNCCLCIGRDACPYGGEAGHPARWFDRIAIVIIAFAMTATFAAGVLGALHIEPTWRNWLAGTFAIPLIAAAVVSVCIAWAAWRDSAAIRKEMDREDDDDY